MPPGGSPAETDRDSGCVFFGAVLPGTMCLGAVTVRLFVEPCNIVSSVKHQRSDILSHRQGLHALQGLGRRAAGGTARGLSAHLPPHAVPLGRLLALAGFQSVLLPLRGEQRQLGELLLVTHDGRVWDRSTLAAQRKQALTLDLIFVLLPVRRLVGLAVRGLLLLPLSAQLESALQRLLFVVLPVVVRRTLGK